MGKVNVIRPDKDGGMLYDDKDKNDIVECTNKRGRVVRVTRRHYERYYMRDGLQPVGGSPNYINVVNNAGVKIKTTETWLREFGSKFDYKRIKSTAGTERKKT
jgi:hypothetical protein